MNYNKLLLSTFFFFFVWHLASANNLIDSELFPSPVFILSNTYTLLTNSEILFHLFYSLKRLFIGFFIGWSLGVLMALISGASNTISVILQPFINFGYSLPKVALLPLILVVMGIGEASKITLIATGVFFLVFISVYNELVLLLSNPIMNISKVYSVQGFRFWYHIIFKGLILSIVTGSKAAFGYGLVLVVVAEAQMTKQGIGYFLWQSWDQFQILNIYSSILIIGFVGLVAGYMFDIVLSKLVSKFDLS